MKEASKIAKQLVEKSSDHLAGKKNIAGINLAATAPEAFEASRRISAIALSPNGKSPPRREKKTQPKLLPSLGSPQALRETHRLIRSQPNYKVMMPLNVQFSGNTVTKDFDSWDPESINEENNDNQIKLSDDSLLNFEFKMKSNTLFIQAVEEIISKGVYTATGSGHRRPVSNIRDKNVESIISRIPTVDGFLNTKHIKKALGSELNEVKAAYIHAAAISSLEYSLKDPEFSKESEIDKNSLIDDSSIVLWTNLEYQLKEWRVYRNTGVDGNSVMRSFQQIDRGLCTNLSIMLELQYLWLDGSFPQVWWENMPSTGYCTYSQALFVDVNQPKFRGRLPFMLDDFIIHLETYAKDVRDALLEYWVITAGGKLSNYISKLPDDSNYKIFNEPNHLQANEVDNDNTLKFDSDEEKGEENLGK